MKKILVTLLAVMTVFAAFAVTPELTLSGSGSFEVLVDENGLDGSVSTSAGAEFEISQTATDATWSLGYTVALVDGTIDVTAGDFSLTTDLFELALTSNKFAITPAALSGLTVYYEDLDPDTAEVDKDVANPDAEWKLADDKFGVDYSMDVAEMGTLSVGGYYGVQSKTVGHETPDAYDDFVNKYVYVMEDEETILLDDDDNPIIYWSELKDELPDPVAYNANMFGVNAGFTFAGMLEGLSVNAEYGSEDVKVVDETAVLTLKATETLNGITTNLHTWTATETTSIKEADASTHMMAKLSYSKGIELIDGLTVTPHGVFLYKTGYADADASDNGWTAMKQGLRGELSGEASLVTFGPDVAFTMDNISVSVNHDFTYKLAGDLHYILDNASIDYSMDMLTAGVSTKAWVADIMSSVDNDITYAAVINPNVSVTPVENVTVSADVYYDLSDEEIEIPLGYEANVDYAFSPIHVGFTLGTATFDDDNNRTNNEDMHWYAYVKGSFEF